MPTAPAPAGDSSTGSSSRLDDGPPELAIAARPAADRGGGGRLERRGQVDLFHAHLAGEGLRFINADDLAVELGLGGYEAADLAASLRASLIQQGESFVFETVLSDPVGEKVRELADAARHGMHVVMVFIRIDSPDTSRQRVAMRVLQGGHDVPDEKLTARFHRTLANLERAIAALPVVIVFDNTSLARPFALEAVYAAGQRIG